MELLLSRRAFTSSILGMSAAGVGGAAQAQPTIDALTRKLPPVLRPLMAEVPLDVIELADAVLRLEREAERLNLPASILTPRSLATLPSDPERLYEQLIALRGAHQDRCVLYTFRCAVYFAKEPNPEPERLKWWNWKDAARPRKSRR